MTCTPDSNIHSLDKSHHMVFLRIDIGKTPTGHYLTYLTYIFFLLCVNILEKNLTLDI